ncbi:MAG: DUF192 domain-containing protein [Algibacter sp.]
MKNNRVYLFLYLILLVFSFSTVSCKDEKKVVKQTEISFNREGVLSVLKQATDSVLVKLEIEIADTDYDTQTGLMYRNTMKSNRGMLFVFDDVTPRHFYMKNTRIALDLIFIDENKTIVSFQKNAKPFDETSLPSNVPAKYVLEVNAGKVDTWGITVGDRLIF